MTTKSKKEDKYALIKEEFEKEYCYENKLGATWSYPTTPQNVWQFIVKFLDQQRKEIVEEIQLKLDTMAILGKRRDQKIERPLLLWKEVIDYLNNLPNPK